MNRSFDRLALVNTYGAFGSVGMERYELVIEGTLSEDPEHAEWRAYELPCKPGDVARRPCVLGPYHRRLDWLIWFAAMDDRPREAWVVHLVWKLLDGDRGVRELLAVDPFDGKVLEALQLRALYEQATGDPGEIEDRFLEPATRRQVVARMLNNLRNIYEVRGERRLDSSRFRDLKKDLIERQCVGLIEFIEPQHTLDLLVGQEDAKKRLADDARCIASGVEARKPIM